MGTTSDTRRRAESILRYVKQSSYSHCKVGSRDQKPGMNSKAETRHLRLEECEKTTFKDCKQKHVQSCMKKTNKCLGHDRRSQPTWGSWSPRARWSPGTSEAQAVPPTRSDNWGGNVIIRQTVKNKIKLITIIEPLRKFSSCSSTIMISNFWWLSQWSNLGGNKGTKSSHTSIITVSSS